MQATVDGAGVNVVSVQYLLPCPCGQQIVVEPRQAGEMIPCSCGAAVQVPTLLEMTGLEPAASEPVAQRAPPAWGLKQQLRLVGSIVVLAGCVGAVWLYIERPISRFDMITPEQIQETARNLTPSRSWETWEMMKQGLDRRTDQRYEAAVDRFRLWRLVVGGTALIGVALIVAGAVGARERKK
jgi:hypothetical protein